MLVPLNAKSLRALLEDLDSWIILPKYRSDSLSRFMLVVTIFGFGITFVLIYLLSSTLYCFETEATTYLFGFPIIFVLNAIMLLVYRFTILPFTAKNSAALLVTKSAVPTALSLFESILSPF